MTADPYRVRVSGPLAQHGRDLASELMRRGYGRERAARHVQLLAQLSRWLDGQGLAACDLSEDAVAQFLAARAAAGYAEKYSTRWMLRLLGCVPALTLLRPRTPRAATPPAADGLPRAWDAGMVAGVLGSCDTRTAAGRRDYAVLAILSRLGLRVSEVAGLQLDDIDWASRRTGSAGQGRPRRPPPASGRRGRGAGRLPVRRPPPGQLPRRVRASARSGHGGDAVQHQRNRRSCLPAGRRRPGRGPPATSQRGPCA